MLATFLTEHVCQFSPTNDDLQKFLIRIIGGLQIAYYFFPKFHFCRVGFSVINVLFLSSSRGHNSSTRALPFLKL